MKLKFGKYKGYWLCDLIGESPEKYSYFKWLLSNPKTPENLRQQMKAMDNAVNFKWLDKFKKLPESSKQFWSNENRNFIDYLEHNKIKL